MRCLTCSAELPEASRFCPACGSPSGSHSQLPTGLATPSVAEAALRRGASDSPVGRLASSPSLDGPATSIELLDAGSRVVFSVAGARWPGTPEPALWREMLEKISTQD